MASKTGQITIKKSVSNRLDEMRNNGEKSYSEVIEQMQKENEALKHENESLRGELLRSKANNKVRGK